MAFPQGSSTTPLGGKLQRHLRAHEVGETLQGSVLLHDLGVRMDCSGQHLILQVENIHDVIWPVSLVICLWHVMIYEKVVVILL